MPAGLRSRSRKRAARALFDSEAEESDGGEQDSNVADGAGDGAGDDSNANHKSNANNTRIVRVGVVENSDDESSDNDSGSDGDGPGDNSDSDNSDSDPILSNNEDGGTKPMESMLDMQLRLQCAESRLEVHKHTEAKLECRVKVVNLLTNSQDSPSPSQDLERKIADDKQQLTSWCDKIEMRLLVSETKIKELRKKRKSNKNLQDECVQEQVRTIKHRQTSPTQVTVR